MRLIKEALISREQNIVTLENGQPCPHCHGGVIVPVEQHLVRWTIPNALVLYVGEEVVCICLDCLDEKRGANETDRRAGRTAKLQLPRRNRTTSK